LVFITVPVIVLFSLITLMVSLETSLYNYLHADKVIDSRIISVGSSPEPFTGTLRAQLEKLPHVVGCSPTISMSCKTTATVPTRVICLPYTRDILPMYDRQVHIPQAMIDVRIGRTNAVS
jgi:hypothetical protein